ncbi:MAG: hypothetical protein HZA66_05820 [Rhodopseudomonas palustris]|uniref:Uncharacterized protein n=1 Tax=Rhodopseudomonas palustris TaxID=1076 RepID=A0A933RV49_RHOPL|nr:hypothetical protein [Rhodopseudomonas palustris]
MSTKAELQQQRATAGAAYLAALANLKTAYVNLYALDLALSNRNVSATAVPSFIAHDRLELVNLAQHFRHAEFAPTFETNSWWPEIIASLETRMRNYPNPE